MTSGELIHAARLRAGLSQTELARRAGVTQSVISAYEHDRREPSVSTLRKILEAAGHSLVIDAAPKSSLRRGLPDTPTGRRLRRRRRAIIEMLAKGGVTNPRVFGSVARSADRPGSDIDLVVDLGPDVSLVGLIGLERRLGELLGTTVDLVPAAGLKPGIKDDVLAEAIPL